jgi:AraC-like DNA-binding protein
MIDHPLLGRLLWSIPLSPTQHGVVLLHLGASELAQCVRLLEGVCALSETKDSAYHPDRHGLLVQLLGILARQLPASTPDAPVQSNPAVLAALKLIDQSPEHEWTLETLAERVHAKPTYLVRMFGKLTGLPPMAYLRRRRLEMATSLLVASKHTISEIGGMVGWADANYFARRFHAEFGLSPSAYRERYANVSKSHENGPVKLPPVSS